MSQGQSPAPSLQSPAAEVWNQVSVMRAVKPLFFVAKWVVFNSFVVDTSQPSNARTFQHIN